MKCDLVVASVLAVAILCILHVDPIIATPAPRITNTKTGSSPQSITEVVSNNESFFKRVVKKSVAHVLFPFFVTLEIIWNSTGSHSDIGSFSNDPLADTQIHVICATILKLWTDLRMLEDAQRVYIEAMDNIVNAEESNVNETYQDIISKIDKAYASDLVLGQRYVRLKQETTRELIMPSNHSDVELALTPPDRDKLLHKNRQLGPRLMLFKFHREFLNSKGDNHILAKSIVSVSKDEKRYEKIQKLFEKTLEDVGPLFGVKGGDGNADKLLFTNLRKMIAGDKDLRLIFEKITTELQT